MGIEIRNFTSRSGEHYLFTRTKDLVRETGMDQANPNIGMSCNREYCVLSKINDDGTIAQIQTKENITPKKQIDITKRIKRTNNLTGEISIIDKYIACSDIPETRVKIQRPNSVNIECILRRTIAKKDGMSVKLLENFEIGKKGLKGLSNSAVKYITQIMRCLH